MMENGFSPSSRSELFPAGLRVLVVDDDLTWLKILEKMLKKCSYEVTTCSLAREALSLLRERKEGYDIVISDVNMPDMDGFKLLEHVGLEMDLPVIMMSVDGETTRVMKGVQHGACDYLLKPIRMKELRNIWQHVFRKKIHEVRDIESLDCVEDIQLLRHVQDQSDHVCFLSRGDSSSAKKRKDFESKHEDRDFGESACVKKARVVWSVDLHQKFVKAVNQIGFDKVGPKKILDLMNVPWLTRENVASHLQKYRLYLTRLQKENDLKVSSSGMNPADLPPSDPTQISGLQSSTTPHTNDIVDGNYKFASRKMVVESQDLNKFQKNEVSSTLRRTNKCAESDNSNAQDASSSGMGCDQSFGLLEKEVNFLAPDSNVTGRYYWRRADSDIHGTKEQAQLQGGIRTLPCLERYTQVQHLHQSETIRHQPSIREADKTKRPLNPTNRQITDLPSVSFKKPTQASVSRSMTSTSMKSQDLDQSGVSNSEMIQRNLISGCGSALASSDENLQNRMPQGGYASLGFQHLDFWDYYDPELLAAAPIQLHEERLLDYYEYLNNSTGYIPIDQGLFLA